MKLRPAYPYFGSKAAVADQIWSAFSADVPNFVDPFCGSASVLLARPVAGKIETLNDAHAFIPNFLRAIQRFPDEVAEAASWPVSEVDMHARHASLLERATAEWVERLREDASYCDVEMAAWWVWGASIWIGSGWCDHGHRNSGAKQRPALGEGGGEPRFESYRKRPAIGGRGTRPNGKNGGRLGVGIFRQLPKQLPHLAGPGNERKGGRGHQLPALAGSDGSGVGYGRGIFASGRREDLMAYFVQLANRLAYVRITCGDWTRVVTPAVTTSHGLTAVLLDPPYNEPGRAKLYAKDSMTISTAVREWAIANGENRRFRIALCGYDGEHEMPNNWREFAWKTNGGYSNQDGENSNANRERIWFSPYCLGGDLVAGPLFANLKGSPS